jgi:DNA-binding Lrp family transcriptional regulator
MYRVQIRLRNTAPLKENELLKACKALPNIAWIVDLSGPWDIALIFLCENTYDFEKSIDKAHELFADSIEKTTTSIITQIQYLIPSQFAAKNYIPKITGYAQKKSVLHDNEYAVLTSLIDDGRKTVLQIAKETGMSATTATYHLRQLLKNKRIMGFRPILDYSKLGLDHFKIMIALHNPAEKKKCTEFDIYSIPRI